MTRKKPIHQKEESSVPIASKKDFINTVIKKKQKNKFLSEHQEDYYNILKTNQITIASGPAGVGKSYIAMKAAVDLLIDPDNSYEKIIIVRPAVEAEEKLGSLPGNLEEKLDPYIFPSYYLLNKIIGKESREKLKEAEIIEVFALAYMRGMNIDNSISRKGQLSCTSRNRFTRSLISISIRFVIYRLSRCEQRLLKRLARVRVERACVNRDGLHLDRAAVLARHFRARAVAIQSRRNLHHAPLVMVQLHARRIDVRLGAFIRHLLEVRHLKVGEPLARTRVLCLKIGVLVQPPIDSRTTRHVCIAADVEQIASID